MTKPLMRKDDILYYTYMIENLFKRAERNERNKFHPITWRLVADRCNEAIKQAHITGDKRELVSSFASLATYVNTLETGMYDKKAAT